MATVAAFGQIAIAAIFILSSAPKLRSFASFKDHIAETLPRLTGASGFVAASVVAAEVVTSVTLLAINPPWIGLLFALVVMTSFTVYLSILVVSRPGTPCGCASGSDQPASWIHLIRNLAIISLTIISGLAAATHAEASAGQQMTVAAPSMITGAFLLYLGEIAGFFRRSERERMIHS
ncbi:hypothetical protein OG345_13645 [Streptomyces sp. NBC_01220]|uniref:MauE/DoxX family redox-associated membrane protein n=1 Tax=unclassified Streptomyces TaxID=2593676 RepID=UPI003419DCA9|nr:hypothetical protein OG345_13645 [Streptomyces sp. NBC_01220]